MRQWRRNEINMGGGGGARRRAEPGVGFLEEGGKPPLHQLRSLGSAVSSPVSSG